MINLGEQRESLPVPEARNGDPAAWQTLFHRFRLPLYAYACEILKNEQTSLDIVQETFLQASRKLSSLRDDQRFGSWLFAIAHQKIIQHWRKHNRSPITETEIPNSTPCPLESPDEFLIREEQKEQFYSAMAQLPLPQRSALLLHFIEDFSLEEIAQITSTTIGTIKSRIHYGKKALKKLYENR